MPTTTTPAFELSDEPRDLLRGITGFAGAQLEGVDRATGTAELDEYARHSAVVRALWRVVEPGRLAEEHSADIPRLVPEEHAWHAEDLAQQSDHLRTFIVRADPELRYSDDRGETIATYVEQITDHRVGLRRCDEFLRLYGGES